MFKQIYKITNLVNGKFYIGQQIKCDKNEKYLGSGLLINKAIKKYGKENFKKEVICECNSKEVADALEQFCIIYENAREEGYNLAKGGNVIGVGNRMKGKQLSQEWCKNISIGKKGRPAWNKGIHMMSEEAKQKCGIVNKGKIPWNKGLTKEIDDRIKNYGLKQSYTKNKNIFINNYPKLVG